VSARRTTSLQNCRAGPRRHTSLSRATPDTYTAAWRTGNRGESRCDGMSTPTPVAPLDGLHDAPQSDPIANGVRRCEQNVTRMRCELSSPRDTQPVGRRAVENVGEVSPVHQQVLECSARGALDRATTLEAHIAELRFDDEPPPPARTVPSQHNIWTEHIDRNSVPPRFD
jgi:hypothetical protein